MTTLLEERYRRALRTLPASYRQLWQEDMVATFLQRAYAACPDDPEGVDISSPSLAELASVAGLAITVRLGGLGAAPRYLVWGDAIRRVALVGLLFNAIAGLLGPLLQLWIAHRLPGLDLPADFAPPSTERTLLSLTGLLWLPALVAIGYGHRRAAVAFGLAALAPVIVATGADLVATEGTHALIRVYLTLSLAVPLLCLAAFHRDAPAVHPRPWLIAAPIGTALAGAVLLLAQNGYDRLPLVDLPGLTCVTVVIATIVHSVRSRGHRAPADILALALLGLWTFVSRIATFADSAAFAAIIPGFAAMLAACALEAAAVLATTIVLGVSAGRTIQRLPTSP